MATRSNIIVRVPQDYIGKTITFDASKLHCIVGHGERINDVWTAVPHEQKERTPLTICNEYLSIYHHSDGYPEGLGERLQADYKDIDKVLNLMAGGNIGCVVSDYYHAFKDIDGCMECEWKAEQRNEEPALEQAYAYIWDNGKWYIKDFGYHSGNDKRPLLPVLKRLRKQAEMVKIWNY